VRIVVWLAEGTWQAGADAARRFVPAEAQVTLLHVIDPQLADSVHAAYAGLLGRGGGPRSDPAAALTAAEQAAEGDLFEAAAERLGRPVDLVRRRGRVEREVIAAAEDADLLIAVRDGDHTRLGPRSLAPPTRFVVDHAGCPVLLVWPDQAPPLETIPPPPPPPPASPA
jgi:nucleotide-binding universal stress UspA family protein